MTEGSVDLGGARLAYHRRAPLTGGQAESVILLHPWFGCWQFWRQFVEALPELETCSVDLYSLGAGDDWRRFARPQGARRAAAAASSRPTTCSRSATTASTARRSACNSGNMRIGLYADNVGEPGALIRQLGR